MGGGTLRVGTAGIAAAALVAAALAMPRPGSELAAPTQHSLGGGQAGSLEVPTLRAEREDGESPRELQAPADGGVCCDRAPAYPGRNTDGQAGSASGAVVYRAGGAVVGRARRADALLWRTGYGGWEPTIGVAPGGAVYFGARNSNVDTDLLRSTNGGRGWRYVGPPAHRVSLDPFIWVDTATGRVFDSDIDPSVTCPPLSTSDDGGRTWNTTLACGQADHQSITTGPPPKGAAPTSGYRNVAYYCAITGGALAGSSTETGCSRSLDGGATWTPTESPAYPVRPDPYNAGNWCDGAAGHAYAAPDGTLYEPRGWCREPYVAISRDEGASWTRVKVSQKLMPPDAHESGVAADAAGNVYYVWVAANHHPLLSVSRNHGKTWSRPMDILPPGVTRFSAFTDSIDIGGPGRLAMIFMGTENPPKTPDDNLTWNAYLVSTVNALDAAPTFRAATLNDPKTNPLWKGTCDDTRCGNVGDFLDVAIAPDGTPWAALVDSCPGANNTCTDFGVTNPRGEAVAAHVVGGPSLRPGG